MQLVINALHFISYLQAGLVAIPNQPMVKKGGGEPSPQPVRRKSLFLHSSILMYIGGTIANDEGSYCICLWYGVVLRHTDTAPSAWILILDLVFHHLSLRKDQLPVS